MAVYLDCAATTPLDPRVLDEVIAYLGEDFGNAGSRTHEFGNRARRAVERARDQVAGVVAASRAEVFFTSGATESNNLALLGLAEFGRAQGRTHVITTRVEHHAVLEPLAELQRRGFDVTYLPVTLGGWVEPEAVRAALRPETLLVSVMQANNETGVLQPVEQIAEVLGAHPAYFHVDAAQGFGKVLAPLQCPRIDLISVSGHKLCAPKGIGALVARRRSGERPPLAPLMFGGGQERGLRPGTLPVALIAGLGKAAELALAEAELRSARAWAFRKRLLAAFSVIGPQVNGDPEQVLPNVVNLSFPGLDAESVMDAWQELAAVSDGAACTSHSATCSHVLAAMGLTGERIEGAVRLSWCHLTPEPDLAALVAALQGSEKQA
jgi:cysteine desulfurase